MTWHTPKCDRALIELYNAKLSTSIIAERLSEAFRERITKNQVIRRTRTLGLVPRKSETTLHKGRPAAPKPEPIRRRRAPKFKPPSPTFDFKNPKTSRDPDSRPRLWGERLPPLPGSKPALPGEPHTVALPLMQRRRHHCGWPMNDGGPFLFCAQPKATGDRHYCDFHRILSLPAAQRRQRQQRAA
jgi:hypothetical protein